MVQKKDETKDLFITSAMLFIIACIFICKAFPSCAVLNRPDNVHEEIEKHNVEFEQIIKKNIVNDTISITR